MFGLDKHNGKITNLNLRAEKHGDENRPACDIKIAVDLPSLRLDEISPGLCESLFRKPGPGDQLPLVEVGKRPVPGFTERRHPGLEPVRVKQKFPGYELAVCVDDEAEILFFADAEVKNFAIEARDGGTATVTFSVGVQVEEDDIAGLLPFLRDPDAVLTLTPPKSQAQHEEAKKERCESGEPDCGPVEFHDADGVPLCKRCWDSLEPDTTGDGEDIPHAA